MEANTLRKDYLIRILLENVKIKLKDGKLLQETVNALDKKPKSLVLYKNGQKK